MADNRTGSYDFYLKVGEAQRKQNEAHKDLFALSTRDINYLFKAVRLYLDICRKYMHLDDETIRGKEIQAKIRKEVAEAYANGNISQTRIDKIADKVFLDGRGFWSYTLTGIIPLNPTISAPLDDIQRADLISDNVKEVYTVESNLEGINGLEINDHDNRAFFETNDITVKAKLLSIPADAKYILWTELDLLKMLSGTRLSGLEIPIRKEQPGFHSTPSSPLINVLHDIGAVALREKVMISDFGKDTYEIKASNSVTVYTDAEGYSDIMFKSPNVDKLLNQLNSKAYAMNYNSKSVSLTVDEIMEARGLKDRKSAANSLRKEADTLYRFTIDYKDKTTGSFGRRRIVQAIDYVGGKGRTAQVVATYSDAFFKHISESKTIIKRRDSIMKIPGNKTTEYFLACAFEDHERRNIDNPTIRNRLSVANLLEKCKLTAYEDLNDKAQVSQLIITPFREALDYLEERGIFSHKFLHKGGDFLTYEELDRLDYDYRLFSSLIVEVDWYEEADYTQLLEAKASRKPKKRGRPRKTQQQEE